MTLAYLDPASGSMIVSAVVGGVAGVGVFAKQARAKFGRKKRPQFEPNESSEATTAEETEDEVAPVDADETPVEAVEAADEPTTVSSDR